MASGYKLRGPKPKILLDEGEWTVAHYIHTNIHWLIDAQVWTHNLNKRLGVPEKPDPLRQVINAFPWVRK